MPSVSRQDLSIWRGDLNRTDEANEETRTTMRARKRTRDRGARPGADSAAEAETGATTDAMNNLMGDLPEDIPHSFDARNERLAGIREETAEKLRAVRRDMRATASDLRRFLAGAEASRRAEAAELMGGLRGECDARARIWRGLVATMARRRAGATR